jgi:hypothetical protein
MGRRKNNKLAEKPLNIRLYADDYEEIKKIAESRDVADSEVHRELVSEALRARRRKRSQAAPDSPEAQMVAMLWRVEAALLEIGKIEPAAIRDDVQTLSSRIDFLCAQVAYLKHPAERPEQQSLLPR